MSSNRVLETGLRCDPLGPNRGRSSVAFHSMMSWDEERERERDWSQEKGERGRQRDHMYVMYERQLGTSVSFLFLCSMHPVPRGQPGRSGGRGGRRDDASHRHGVHGVQPTHLGDARFRQTRLVFWHSARPGGGLRGTPPQVKRDLKEEGPGGGGGWGEEQ